MRKSMEEKTEKRAQDFANAERMQWERLIENPELIKEVQNLQSRYGLPVPSYRAMFAWQGVFEPIVVKNKEGQLVLGERLQRFLRFSREIEKLEKQFEIPKKFLSNFNSWISMANKGPLAFSMGLPSCNVELNEKKEYIITPNITKADLGNPMSLEVLKYLQVLTPANLEKLKDMGTYRPLDLDPPPQPQPFRNNQKKKDWRPVWEWHKRHPDVTFEEIAEMMGLNPTTVKRHLGEIERQT